MQFNQEARQSPLREKRSRYETETYRAQTQILSSQASFHSVWESGVQEILHHFFFNPAIRGLGFQLHFTLNRLVFPAV